MMKMPRLPRRLRYGLHVYGDDPVVFEQILEQRRDFVTMMGWLENHTNDRDRYDTDNSITVYRYEQRRQSIWLAASIRFTKVRETNSLLSVEMVRSNTAMYGQAQEFVERHLSAKAQRGELFDATRAVVSREDYGTQRALRNLIRLYGYTQGLTAEHPRQGGEQWLMTLSVGLLRAMNRVGIHPTVVTQGKVRPSDATESAVAVVCPATIDQEHRLTASSAIARVLYEQGMDAGIREKSQRALLSHVRPMFQATEPA